ncbi:MAG: thymidylate synthase, partial [Allobaculum sp.]|nr:thymidylate synthase [Allobaculum sp.]
MSAWDEIYCHLCEDILKNGVRVSNRTGVDTIKLPMAHFQLDLGEEFPILTTKQL